MQPTAQEIENTIIQQQKIAENYYWIEKKQLALLMDYPRFFREISRKLKNKQSKIKRTCKKFNV